jgi:hypothetical protein
MAPTVAYYYQTLDDYENGMDSIAAHSTPDHQPVVYLSSFHFGTANDQYYLHLNDAVLSDAFMESLCKWNHTIEFRMMLGGAGGGYATLFADDQSYHQCYGMLVGFVGQYRHIIRGIDLDIEEWVDLSDVQRLIMDIKRDMGERFHLSMAPVARALKYDEPGMGGFVYKDLLTDPRTCHLIDGFNVQCYQGAFNYDTFASIVGNGYPTELLTFGMLGDEFTGIDDPSYEQAIRDYCRFGSSCGYQLQGAILWEFGDTHVDPIVWGGCVSTPYYFLTNVFVDRCERMVRCVLSMLVLILSNMIHHTMHAIRQLFYIVDTVYAATSPGFAANSVSMWCAELGGM